MPCSCERKVGLCCQVACSCSAHSPAGSAARQCFKPMTASPTSASVGSCQAKEPGGAAQGCSAADCSTSGATGWPHCNTCLKCSANPAARWLLVWSASPLEPFSGGGHWEGPSGPSVFMVA